MQLVTSLTDFQDVDQSLQDHNALWLVSESERYRRMFVAGGCPAYMDGDEVTFSAGSAPSHSEVVVLSAPGGSPGFRKLLRSLMPDGSRADRESRNTVLAWYDRYAALEQLTARS